MKTLFLVLLVVAYALAVPSRVQLENDMSAFSDFRVRFNRSYSDILEESQRFAVFRSNLRFIEKHNAEHANGLHTFTVAVNKFADLTNAEFRAQRNGYKGAKMQAPEIFTDDDVNGLPKSVDWRKKGYVVGVKDQGQCGSCWAFSTVASLEGQHFRATKKLVSLSEQNLVDCSDAEGDQGCEGGLMDNGFDYIIKNKGIDTEKSYPYEAVDESCAFRRKNVGATMSSYSDITSGSESALQKATATVGPISVAIDASNLSFQFYYSGVYYDEECSSEQLDHGVAVVGYGTENGKAYWIVRNSWGADWGQKGYILMSRNKDNNCGIATQASFPKI